MAEQGSKPVRKAFGVVVFGPFASRREPEPDVVGGDAPELGSKLLDQMAEFEGPGWIAMHEYDRLAFTLVDEVHLVL